MVKRAPLSFCSKCRNIAAEGVDDSSLLEYESESNDATIVTREDED